MLKQVEILKIVLSAIKKPKILEFYMPRFYVEIKFCSILHALNNIFTQFIANQR